MASQDELSTLSFAEYAASINAANDRRHYNHPVWTFPFISERVGQIHPGLLEKNSRYPFVSDGIDRVELLERLVNDTQIDNNTDAEHFIDELAAAALASGLFVQSCVGIGQALPKFEGRCVRMGAKNWYQACREGMELLFLSRDLAPDIDSNPSLKTAINSSLEYFNKVVDHHRLKKNGYKKWNVDTCRLA